MENSNNSKCSNLIEIDGVLIGGVIGCYVDLLNEPIKMVSKADNEEIQKASFAFKRECKYLDLCMQNALINHEKIPIY